MLLALHRSLLAQVAVVRCCEGHELPLPWLRCALLGVHLHCHRCVGPVSVCKESVHRSNTRTWHDYQPARALHTTHPAARVVSDHVVGRSKHALGGNFEPLLGSRRRGDWSGRMGADLVG